MKRNLNWKRTAPDARDLVYTPRMLSKPPKLIDLRDLCSPVEDQGDIGSCTGNAIVGALEVWQNKRDGSFKDLSRLFVYYNEREYEGTVGQDAGAFVRDGMKVVSKIGVPEESFWPYTMSYLTKPSPEAYADAALRKFVKYYAVQSIIAGKRALADKVPFTVGFTVFESFMSDEVARTGVMPMPVAGDKEVGGHAVLVVGYDDAKKHYICRNSWGVDWGDKGYFYMPYDYLKNKTWCDEKFAIN